MTARWRHLLRTRKACGAASQWSTSGKALTAVGVLSMLLLTEKSARAQSPDLEPHHSVWVSPAAGYSFMALNAHRYNNLLNQEASPHGWGPHLSIAAGPQAKRMRLGASYTLTGYGDFLTHDAGLSVSVRTPRLWVFVPHVDASVSYLWLLPNPIFDTNFSASGVFGGIGAGFDTRVSDWLGVGGGLSLLAGRLTRDAVVDFDHPSLANDGSSLAVVVRVDILRVTLFML